MISRSEIMTLERAARGVPTLSVYLDGSAPDPAARRAWRKRLDRALHTLRGRLGGEHDAERRAFDRAVAHLESRLPDRMRAVGAPGWVGFASADGVRYAEALPVAMPTLVRWRPGVHVAPLVRALKEDRPVLVAVVTHRDARLYRYHRGALESLDHLRAVAPSAELSRARGGARPRLHPGVRGATGADESDRQRRALLDDLSRDVTRALAARAGADGWIVVGGSPLAAKAIVRAFPARLADRVMATASLAEGATPAEIAAAAARAAATLRGARDRQTVARLLEDAGAGKLATAGARDTARALEQGAVEMLLVSHGMLQRRPDRAEALLHAAIAQDAHVEDVSGVAAARLDAECGGVCARLRFAPAVLSEGAEPVAEHAHLVVAGQRGA